MQVIPAGKLLGAKVDGMDLALPLSENEVEEIIQAIGRYGVLCFPKQRLTARQHRDFAARFGELEINVASGAYQEPGIPEVMILSNIVKDGKPIGLADAGRCRCRGATARCWARPSSARCMPPTTVFHKTSRPGSKE